MGHHYLLLPRLQVQNGNAQPAWWLIGPPPLTAYGGFTHALTLAIGSGPHDGFCVVHHDIQLLAEALGRYATRHPHQFRAASYVDKEDYLQGTAALSSQPTARCHLDVSIVIRFAADAPIDPSQVKRFLRAGRLAGGTIIDHVEPRVLSTEQEASQAIGSGFAIHERLDLMRLSPGDRDMLDVLLRLTRPDHDFIFPQSDQSERPPTSKQHLAEFLELHREQLADLELGHLLRWAHLVMHLSVTELDFLLRITRSSSEDAKALIERARDDRAWLCPTGLGFLAITPFRKRGNVRGDYPHAYAEPLVGMVQYRSIRRDRLPWWRYRNPQPNAFILTTA